MSFGWISWINEWIDAVLTLYRDYSITRRVKFISIDVMHMLIGEKC